MVSLLKTRPFVRIANLHYPEWNTIPDSILEDINNFISLERLFYPNRKPLYNSKPFINIFKTPLELSLSKMQIENHRTSKYAKLYLIDNYYRDLTVRHHSKLSSSLSALSPSNEFIIARCWIDYNQHKKLLKIINVYETFSNISISNGEDFLSNSQLKYFHVISNLCYKPNFIDNNEFLDKLKRYYPASN